MQIYFEFTFTSLGSFDIYLDAGIRHQKAQKHSESHIIVKY